MSSPCKENFDRLLRRSRRFVGTDNHSQNFSISQADGSLKRTHLTAVFQRADIDF